MDTNWHYKVRHNQVDGKKENEGCYWEKKSKYITEIKMTN